MKVPELLMSIHNKDFNLEKRLEVKKYLPIELKKTIAQSIIYECTTHQNGVVQVDSVQRYMAYVRHMITAHTNLVYTDEDYDVLCYTEYGESTLLNEIVACFENDANECNRILDMMMDDYLDNNSAANQIVVVANMLFGSVSNVLTKIIEKVDELDVNKMLPEGFDMNMLSSFLNNK